MRNMGMTTMTVVTVLIRKRSIMCAVDERWFGCVYFHCLLLVNTYAQPCLFILESLHDIDQQGIQDRKHRE